MCTRGEEDCSHLFSSAHLPRQYGPHQWMSHRLRPLRDLLMECTGERQKRKALRFAMSTMVVYHNEVIFKGKMTSIEGVAHVMQGFISWWFKRAWVAGEIMHWCADTA